MKNIFLSILMIISISSYTQEKCGTKFYTDLLKEKHLEYNTSREEVNLQTEKWIQSNPNHSPKTIITMYPIPLWSSRDKTTTLLKIKNPHQQSQ